MYYRPIFRHLFDRLTEPRRFIQVLSGPRQVGKTTLARQVMAKLAIPSHYASADAPSPHYHPPVRILPTYFKSAMHAVECLKLVFQL